jgi:hypothetical protein
MAAIGRLPDTLADRCILVRMQRKTAREQCERLRALEAEAPALTQACLQFVARHSQAIAAATPVIPPGLNDRAADLWEPLLALADLAGGRWPALARDAALALATAAQDASPIGTLFLDLGILFIEHNHPRLFSRTIVDALNLLPPDRPWKALCRSKSVTEYWLSHLLRPYGIRPAMCRIGDIQSRGYHKDDFADIFQRYISRVELNSLLPPPDPNEPHERA